MYIDPEDARSDLFLAAATYLILGPALSQLVLRLAPVAAVVAVAGVVGPLLVTLLVPLLLARYRGEKPADYGLGATRGPGLGLGAQLALPLVLAALVAAAVGGLALPEPDGGAVDVSGLGEVEGGSGGLASVLAALFPGGGLVGVLGNLATWVGALGLAVYVTVKARDAFRSDPRALRSGGDEVARALAVGAAVGAVLLLVGLGSGVGAVLLPVGAAGMVLLARRALPGPATTTRATLVAPVVVLVLGPLNPLRALFDPAALGVGLWLGALAGAVGLVVALVLEGRRTAWPAVALALLLGVLVPYGLP